MIHQKRKNIIHRRGVLFSGEGDKTQAKWLFYKKKNNNNKIGTKKMDPKHRTDTLMKWYLCVKDGEKMKLISHPSFDKKPPGGGASGGMDTKKRDPLNP